MKIFVSLLGVGALCALSLLSGCSNKTNSQVADSKGSELSQAIRNYAGDIQSAIEWHFKIQPSFKGKICNLRINLAPDGRLLAVTAEDGDPTLCSDAVKAVKLAKFPKPPSNEVYQIFKNTIIAVRPD
ncbi:cell envelope integrity protein TolA [Hafnia alvei]|uniref:cell envelope integrity protein TolA n=1 Tax=Hafnia alvei TaxID=569 RepID=UPI000E0795A3|nr:cell envelope integrity protein TolA [Hafnia alvei]STQ69067.1 cell envelope integrity inner membrane protein TolA [Hafnia alvei]